MVIGNHLLYNNRQLGGQLSFKRRQQWISELDICLAKQECLDQITKLVIRQDIIGSDHAPLCVTITIPSATITNIELLTKRSAMLGQCYEPPKVAKTLRKSTSFRSTNFHNVTRSLQDIVPPIIPPVIATHAQVSDLVEAGCAVIMDTADRCIQADVIQPSHWDQSRPRWARILERNDPKVIWKSLNWKGSFDDIEKTQPSDSVFKDHFERLLVQNDNSDIVNDVNMNTAPYVPVLDDPFSPSELETVTMALNSGKSYSGICPGIVKVLPVSWFIYIYYLFLI